MAEILIKNMEMPKQMESPITITIFKNGSVWMNDVTFGKGKLPNAKAIEVPPHGDLVDRKKLLEHRFEVYDSNEEVCEDYVETYHILEAPVVLEASKERE